MSNSNDLTTQNIDKQVYIKFYYYKRGKRASGSVYLSEGLKDLIRERGYSFLDYGFNVLTNDFFIKFTNKEGSISLLDKEKECKSNFTSNKLVKAVLDQVEGIEPSILYELQEVEKHIFAINKEISPDEYAQNHKKLIQWNATEQETSKDKDKNDLWLKFYKQYHRLSGTLIISDEFLEIARQNKMTHIQFGYEREARSVLVRLNNSGEGLSLLSTTNNEYRAYGIGTQGILTSLNAAGFPIDFSVEYFLEAKEDLVFQIANGNNNELDTNAVQWISNKEERNFKEERKRNSKELGKHKKNESKLFVRFKKSSFKDKPAYNIVLSKAFFRLCVEQQAKNMQLGILKQNNTVYIRINKTGEGIPLPNERKKYRYEGWGVSGMFYALNSEQDVLQVKTDYPVEKINDTLFKIVTTDSSLEKPNFEDNSIVWLSHKNSYLKIRQTFLQTGGQKEELYFSSPVIELFYNAKEEFLDIGYNSNKQMVAIKLTNDITDFPITRFGGKHQNMISRTKLYQSIKDSDLKLEPNKEYEVKEIAPSLFVVKSNRLDPDVVDVDDILWLSQTLSKENN